MVEKGKAAFVGPELYRKTLGVIGLGAIGALVANIGLNMGMDVYGYDPYLSVDAALRLDRHVKVVKDDALERGKVAAYATDFPDNRLVAVKHVVALPHLGASTPESEENCAVMAARELRDYLENGNIKNSVNFPSVEMARSGVLRLGIIHRNIPAMLANITLLLSKEGVNVENMTNKSKGDYAYTMLDTGAEVDDGVISSIRAIPGILRVRVIR